MAERFNGQDKVLIRLHSITMVEQVISRFALQVDQLMISANRNIEQYKAFGYPIVRDQVDGFSGPLAGFHSGLTYMNTRWLACTPCDTPFIPLNMTNRLLEQALDSSAKICFAQRAGQPEYLHTVLHHSVIGQLLDYLQQGNAAVKNWYRTLPEEWLAHVDFTDEAESFNNINDQDDLDRIFPKGTG